MYYDSEDNTPLSLCKRCQAVITQLRNQEQSLPAELCANCWDERFRQLRRQSSPQETSTGEEHSSDSSLDKPHLCPTRSRPDHFYAEQAPITCYNPVNKISVRIDASQHKFVGEDKCFSESPSSTIPQRRSRDRQPVARKPTREFTESEIQLDNAAVRRESCRLLDAVRDPEPGLMYQQNKRMTSRTRSNASESFPAAGVVDVESSGQSSEHRAISKLKLSHGKPETNQEVPTEVVFERRKTATRYSAGTEGRLEGGSPLVKQGREKINVEEDETIIEHDETPDTSDENLDQPQASPNKQWIIDDRKAADEDRKASKTNVVDEEEEVSLAKKFKLFGLNTVKRLPFFKTGKKTSESSLDDVDGKAEKDINLVTDTKVAKNDDVEKIPAVEVVRANDATTSKGPATNTKYDVKDAVNRAVQEAKQSHKPISLPPGKEKAERTEENQNEEGNQSNSAKKKGLFGKLFSAGGKFFKKS